MGGQHAAVAVQQRHRGVADLAVAGASGHLQMGLDQMRHRAADAAMAIAQETAMGVERHLAVRLEITRRTRAAASPRLASRDLPAASPGNGEAVIDRGITHIGDRDAGGRLALAIAISAPSSLKAGAAVTPDRSLGTIASVHFLEQLSVTDLGGVVGLAAEKLGPGGVLACEVFEPAALATVVSPVPLHAIPVEYLMFLLHDAGSASVDGA